jgi:hypothetical protein
MKWPWVSRLAYEVLERERWELLRTVERLELLVEQERQKYGELVGDVIEMKREGFVPAVKYDEPSVTPEVHPDIADALDRVGLTGSARGQMLAWAERQMVKGADPKNVARDLMAGGLATAETM